MGKEGMRPATEAKLARAMVLVQQGNKLTWALRAAGLSLSVWYRWAGWKRIGNYRRDVYVRPERITAKVARVDALVAEGVRKATACRLVGLSYWTYHSRKKGRAA